MAAEVYKELATKMMLPDSERMTRIWAMICNEEEAALLLSLPGTAKELAEKTNRLEAEVQAQLEELFHKGVAFESVKPHGTIYFPPRHLIQFHDASTQWPEAPEEYHQLWKEFMAEEYPPMIKVMMDAGIPAFMRVVPTAAVAEDIPNLLPSEDPRQVIENATAWAVCKCPCRLVEQACDTNLETCLQFDKGAKYAIKRGTGKELTKEEALKIMIEAEENGLMHAIDNKATGGTFMCNCCSCCCMILQPYKKGADYRPVLTPSRYLAIVVPDQCVQDELCISTCPTDAITMEGEDGAALVDEAICVGCGLCVTDCPSGALSLKEIRDPDFIPS